MSEEENTPAEPKAEEPEPKTAKDDKPAPPWGSDEEFNPEKAWKLIQNLRGDIDELKPKATKLQELEDAQKSEQEKLTENLTAAETRAAEAELRAMRLEVATDKGLTKAQAKYLTGTTEDELSAAADELLELFAPSEESKGGLPRKPSERLRGGADPTQEPEETDPRKLAANLPRY